MNIIDFAKNELSQFEFVVLSAVYGNSTFRLAVLYRPNPTTANNLDLHKFWTEFENFLSKHACCTEELILTGDLNFHLDKPNNPNTVRFNSLLDEYGLQQKINVPTHVAGHILDVLVVRDDSVLNSFCVSDPCLINDDGNEIRDHFAIHWSIKLEKPKPSTKTIEYREIDKINMSALCDDISNSELTSISGNDQRSADILVKLYNSTLEKILNRHAPLKSRTVFIRNNTPWYNQNVTVSKRRRRQAESLEEIRFGRNAPEISQTMQRNKQTAS